MTSQDHLAEIAANPDDEGAYLVFADWLQEQGDAWGKLIVLQHQLDNEPGNDVVATATDRLIKKNRKEWCADLYGKPEVILEWKWGFIRSARILAGWDDKSKLVEALLESPLTRALDSLVYFNSRRDMDSHVESWKKVVGERTQVVLTTAASSLVNTEPESVRWLQWPDAETLARADELTNLEWLDLNVGTEAPIPDYTKLTRLRRLDINYGGNAAFLPEAAFAIPNLAYVSMYSNSMGPRYNMGRVNALLAGFVRAHTPSRRRVIESRLLLAEESRAQELATTDDLLRALDNNVKDVRRTALRCLEARIENPLVAKPLEKGDVVARLGRLDLDKDVLKDKLAALGVKLMTKITGKTTHVLLGLEPRGKQLEIADEVVLCQPHLSAMLEASQPATEAAGDLDLEALLLSHDEGKIQQAAKELQRLGSIPVALWPALFFIHQDTSLKGKGRKAVKKLFPVFAPDALETVIARHFKTSALLAGEKKLAKRLKALEKAAGVTIDVHRLAEILVEKRRQGIVYYLSKADEKQSSWALDQLTDEEGCLDLSGLMLNDLPAAVKSKTALRALNASGNNIVSWPASLASLPQLEDLRLSDNSINRLPDDIGLEQLTRLDLGANLLTTVPRVVFELPALVHLDLSAESYGREVFIRKLPDDIGRLQSLRTLSLCSQRFESFPESFFDLPLEELDLMSAELPSIPKGLGRMPLKVLDVRYTNWRGAAGRAALEALLPTCEIRN